MSGRHNDQGITLFLCGDVMTGRGIDRIMPHPGKPDLYETVVRHADTYIELAEAASGPIPRSVAPAYIWGTALTWLEQIDPDARIINLETAITTCDSPWPLKGIHYRMHPANIACLAIAGIDCCTLANNHVLDWGREGLAETIVSLKAAGLAHAGAGADLAAAATPLAIAHAKGRIVVVSLAATNSGVPLDWAATDTQSGINLLPDLSPETARSLRRQWQAWRQPDDIVIVSIHWGGNWGYAVDQERRRFAHALVDEANVHLVYGHSSHHPMPLEIYRGRLLIYGCGDLINDYEGIEGYEHFHPELALLYFPHLALDGSLMALSMCPLRRRRFTLQQASEAESRWLATMLAHESRLSGFSIDIDASGKLQLHEYHPPFTGQT